MLAETICSAASAAGLGIAAVTAYRKRFLAATRIAAYSLVPVGLVLTGVVEWVTDIAFKPSVWLGFGLLGVAWLLFITTRAVERRTGGTRKERKAAARAAREGAVEPAASAPSLGAGAPAAQPQQQERPKKQAAASGSGEDFSDIEAILKKHGI
uniref:Integral membrane protein n=1 Tax=Streptomyces sp. NBC_00008 TaxID=2903610 RepID=A0AAU2W060_9ACTN